MNHQPESFLELLSANTNFSHNMSRLGRSLNDRQFISITDMQNGSVSQGQSRCRCRIRTNACQMVTLILTTAAPSATNQSWRPTPEIWAVCLSRRCRYSLSSFVRSGLVYQLCHRTDEPPSSPLSFSSLPYAMLVQGTLADMLGKFVLNFVRLCQLTAVSRRV